jgi:hypothetical protein
MPRWSLWLALPGAVLWAKNASATLLAYEGFTGSAGTIDGQAQGQGFTTAPRVLGNGGTDNACDGVVCACPEVPGDAKVQRGSGGPAWTSSSTISAKNQWRAAGLTYPGLPTTGGSVKLVSGAGRSFRTLDAASAAAAPLTVSFANGPASATRATFGKAGTTLFVAFLAAMDCGWGDRPARPRGGRRSGLCGGRQRVGRSRLRRRHGSAATGRRDDDR